MRIIRTSARLLVALMLLAGSVGIGVTIASPAQAATPHEMIAAKARQLGLGSPHADSPVPRRTPKPRDNGYWQRFQRGWVYWSPKTDAHAVRGAIFRKYAELKWEQGLLGFPLTDELPTADGRGRFNRFEGGSVYWSPKTGAHEIHGVIRGKWASLGREQGLLGFPTSDEFQDGTFRRNNFERGYIRWSSRTGTQVTHSLANPALNPVEE